MNETNTPPTVYLTDTEDLQSLRNTRKPTKQSHSHSTKRQDTLQNGKDGKDSHTPIPYHNVQTCRSSHRSTNSGVAETKNTGTLAMMTLAKWVGKISKRQGQTPRRLKQNHEENWRRPTNTDNPGSKLKHLSEPGAPITPYQLTTATDHEPLNL